MLERIRQELAQGRTLLQFGFISALGQGLGMVAPLVIAGVFSPELLGSYYLTKIVLFFFASMLLSYMQTPFVVFAGREREKTGRINKAFSVQCTFYGFSSLVFLAVVIFAAGPIAKFAEISRRDLLCVVPAFAGLALKTFVCDLSLATGRRMSNALAELVFGISTLLCIIVLYAAGMVNMQTVLLVYFVSGVIVILAFGWRLDYGMLRPFVFDRQQFKETVTFAKWIIIGTTAAYFIGWGDSIVLRYLTPMSDVGVYSFGYEIFKGMIMLIFSIYVYFLPFVSEHIEDSVAIRDYLGSKRPRIILLGLAVIALCFLAAPYAFRLVYKNTYQDSVTVFRILLIAAVLALYNVFYEAVFNASKKYRITQSVTVLQVSLNLLLDWILVPVMGMTGAAVAAVIGYGCRVAIYEIYFRKTVRAMLKL